jgi:hypothetical protein
MPLHTDAERRWAYYVPQPLPADAVAQAPVSVRALRLLDPAVGSGHFLIVAFDLLFALYQEEARHRGEADRRQWSPRAIVERILEFNLHGIDIDPRAVQIAAAALWLKARQTCPTRSRAAWAWSPRTCASGEFKERRPRAGRAAPRGRARDGHPRGWWIPSSRRSRAPTIVGSLLRVDDAVEQALDAYEQAPNRRTGKGAQGSLFGANEAHPTGTGTLEGPSFPAEQRELIGREEAKNTILDRLEGFLRKHTHGDDLGLRLRGEQLAAGVRFVRLIREGQYDLVVGNPPYQGTAKMADAAYVQKTYPKGKADLFAAFLERGLQLVRPGGVSAMLTMRNWMFIKQYSELRQWLLKTYDLRALGDFDRGGFEDVPDEVVSVVASVFRHSPPSEEESVALQPTPPEDRARDSERTQRKRVAVLAGFGRTSFSPKALQAVPEWPLVYSWDDDLLTRYASTEKVGDVAPSRKGICTGDDVRACRFPWEVQWSARPSGTNFPIAEVLQSVWVPTIVGGKGKGWIEPLSLVINWSRLGLENKVMHEARWGSHSKRVQNESFYGHRGIAFSMIGSDFSARAHRYQSIFGNKGSSVFPQDLAAVLGLMNSSVTRGIMESLNPGIGFEVGDVNRLPLFPIANADEIFASIERAFTEHESHREPSVEFRHPGPSPWRNAQEWAQSAVDRPEGAPLPAYVPEHDPEPATDHLSNALGVVLGRFGPAGEGILDPAKDSLAHALPAGILFLDGTLDAEDLRDSLGHPSGRPLRDAFETAWPRDRPGHQPPCIPPQEFLRAASQDVREPADPLAALVF